MPRIIHQQGASLDWHNDAGRFAGLLQRHCTNELGVEHVLDHVVSVDGSPGEDIRFGQWGVVVIMRDVKISDVHI